jgi:hypothetical protein
MLYRFGVWVVALALLVWVRPADATERQWHLGAGAGFVGFDASEIDLGPAVQLHAAYGLSDMFDVRLELKGSRNPVHYAATDTTTTQTFFAVDAAFIYKLDVIRWVPYFGLVAGYHGTDAEPLPDVLARADFAIGGMGGLDYAFSRSVAVGVQAEYQWLLEGTTVYAALLYGEYRWGY